MASCWSWVTYTTGAVPPHSSARSWGRSSSRSCASRLLIGSSSRNTLGRRSNARARATRCRWPPESAAAGRVRSSSSCSISRTAATSRDRAARSTRGSPCQARGCAHAQVGIEGIALEHHRHLAPGRRQGGDVAALQKDATGIGPIKAGDQRRVVLLPQPLGPSSARHSPGATASSSPSRIGRGPIRRPSPSSRSPVAAIAVAVEPDMGTERRNSEGSGAGQRNQPLMAPWVRPATICRWNTSSNSSRGRPPARWPPRRRRRARCRPRSRRCGAMAGARVSRSLRLSQVRADRELVPAEQEHQQGGAEQAGPSRGSRIQRSRCGRSKPSRRALSSRSGGRSEKAACSSSTARGSDSPA